MTPLDEKINQHFAGLVVRKDLVKRVKGNAIVPSYVLEYLLGQYCATSDEASIASGVETVKSILSAHYVHRNEAGLVRSTIRERGQHKVIDKVSVSLNDKRDVYEASFSNLGVNRVLVPADVVKRHPKLLVSGVWCIADLTYLYTEERDASPWVLDRLKPIQLSRFDLQSYLTARRQFSTAEWIDVIMQSIGFDPSQFGERSKLLQLVRLVPYCERNYNLIELGPKGTGKSHIYSEFSPHGILISGGEVTVAKLFVNNATSRIGLVGYWDTVAFDEFAGRSKRANKALVDILKNYMANKSFSRGIETLGAEASMVFVGNTQNTLPYMLRHSDLFEELPPQYYDSAFLDRLHFYIPGWEMDIIRGEMFSAGYGFVVDYLAEILRNLRDRDYSHLYQDHLTLLSGLSTRDRTAVQKSFSGLMKVIFPHGEASAEEVQWLMRFAIEGRKRVKDQLLRIDKTYTPVEFGYEANGQTVLVKTLEQETYPQYYGEMVEEEGEGETAVSAPPIDPIIEDDLQETHLTIQENQRGISYESLFGAYLKEAKEIVVTDPYIRLFYQARNLMEFLEVLARQKRDEDSIRVQLITAQDASGSQEEYLQNIQASCATAGIQFQWQYDDIAHARHIVIDNGWKILLDRGLDIFQQYEMNDAFSFTNRLQRYRACKQFEVTFVRTTTG